MKVRLDEIILSSDSENIHRLFQLVSFLIRSRVESEHQDVDFTSLLGLVQSHLLRCYSSDVHDVSHVDWESSQQALLLTLRFQDASES
jgi:hypothetical protein